VIWHGPPPVGFPWPATSGRLPMGGCVLFGLLAGLSAALGFLVPPRSRVTPCIDPGALSGSSALQHEDDPRHHERDADDQHREEELVPPRGWWIKPHQSYDP